MGSQNKQVPDRTRLFNLVASAAGEKRQITWEMVQRHRAQRTAETRRARWWSFYEEASALGKTSSSAAAYVSGHRGSCARDESPDMERQALAQLDTRRSCYVLDDWQRIYNLLRPDGRRANAR